MEARQPSTDQDMVHDVPGQSEARGADSIDHLHWPDELAPQLLRKRGNEAVEGDRNSEVVSKWKWYHINISG